MNRTVRPAPTREELRPATAGAALSVCLAAALLVWTAVTTYDAFHDDDCPGPCHELVILKILAPVGVLLAAGLLAMAVGGLVAVLRRSPAAGTTLTVLGVAFIVCAVPAAALRPWVGMLTLAVGLGNIWLGQRATMKDWA